MENLKPCPLCKSMSIWTDEMITSCEDCGCTANSETWDYRTSGWISVDDAKPEINTPVLAGNCNGGMEIGIYRKSGIWIALFVPFGDDGVDNILDDTTHWMPLPQPPEVKHG